MSAVIVHRWDVRPDPTNRWAPVVPSVVVDEIRRAHQLRNNLVEAEHAYRARVADVWAQYPDLAALTAQVVDLDERIEAAAAAVAGSRQAGRSRVADPEMVARLRDLRAERKTAKAAERDRKTAVYEAAKPAIGQARAWRRDRHKALYRAAVDDGLYWATFNAVADHFETTLKTVARRRAAGQPADIRFRRWTGEGTIAVQLQRGADQPERTVDEISSAAGRWRNVFALVDYPDAAARASMTTGDWRRHARRGATQVRWRLGSGDHATWVTLPVAIGRPLPDGAEIVAAQLTVTRVAGTARASVAVTMRVPDVATVDGRRVAVHLGWRAMPDGTIRVATIAGAARPPELEDHPGAVRWYGDWGEVRVPAGTVGEYRDMAGVARLRDDAHNAAKADLATALEAGFVVEVPGRDGVLAPLTPAMVARWRSPARLARLARTWAVDRPGTMPVELAERLAAWARQDAHLWRWHAHTVDQLAARRADLYAKVAGWVCADAAVVAVDEWSIPPLVRGGGVAIDDTYSAERARANGAIAAAGSLRARIKTTAGRVGAVVVEVGSSGVHVGCGGTIGGGAVSHLGGCDRCGRTVDRDHNAIRQMASGDVPPPAPGSARIGHGQVAGHRPAPAA